MIAGATFGLIFYYGSQQTYYPFDFLTSLEFGFFISAIDPVATISIFRALNVNTYIYTIVFGESTLNDASAIALSNTCKKLQEQIKLEGEINYTHAAIGAFGQFMMYFFGSLLVGLVAGLLISLLFKYLDLHTIPWIEIGTFIICAYIPFVISERIGVSGILAILIEAIVLRNYAFFSMSPWG
jgi:NhaP-type Na+/H+ or K+/H+ antiporter